METTIYAFEIFCIDPEDIHSEHAFAKALAFSASLWGGLEPTDEIEGGIHILSETTTDLHIKIYPVDTTKILTGYVENAFIIKAESGNFREMEAFRRRLLLHLREKLNFKYLRMLQDDVSRHIANRLYPEINAVEGLLRRYLIKFFIQRVGIDWWELTATPKMLEKVKMRLRNRSNEFSYYVDCDVEFADFDDLGQLIYKQSTGFNQPQKVIERITQIETMEDLDLLKSEIRGNYTKYFKSLFRDKNFEGLWKEMSRIRNKVAHQATFFYSDLEKGLYLSQQLQQIILDAESRIDEMVLSLEEKEAIRQASIDAIMEGDEDDANDAVSEAVSAAAAASAVDNRVKLEGPKVIGKIQLPSDNSFAAQMHRGRRIITESEVIEQLEDAFNFNYNDYVGLKWFVTTFLANKNYSIGFTYSLVNILIEKGLIVLYDVPSVEGYTVKALRLPIK